MNDYINKTSLRFILVFMIIIAFSLSLFQVISYFDGEKELPPAKGIKAETVNE